MFWFLAIATGVMLIFMALTFPETLRAITGDGSKPPQKWNRTPFSILGRAVPKTGTDELGQPNPNTHRRSPSPLQIFRVFTQPDVLMVLVCTGVIYSLFYSVTTTTAPLFMSVYPYLTQSTVGLCFIAYGVGGAIGTVVMGKILDYDWRKMEQRYAQLEAESPVADSRLENGTADAHISGETFKRKVDKQDLPIEHTRLKRVPIVFFIEIGASIGYGWSIQAKAHMAVPLILQFIVGLMSMSIMTINQTILVDMYPSQGSSITASNNFVRCLLGAGTISIQDFIINAINPGWTPRVQNGNPTISSQRAWR
ncbi:major facilitator superfamily transporter [Ceratobasidium sp. AG-Ba]|nr:major facilitator superfamily transporter [Ceratobasidium sp. AG-Ba]